MWQGYLLLLGAIVFEVVGTSALKASEQFTRLGPSALVIVCYAAAFYLLARVLAFLPVGIAYALWAGLGIVLITLVGWAVFGQKLDLAGIIGIGLILAGVVVLNLLSKTVPH